MGRGNAAAQCCGREEKKLWGEREGGTVQERGRPQRRRLVALMRCIASAASAAASTPAPAARNLRATRNTLLSSDRSGHTLRREEDGEKEEEGIVEEEEENGADRRYLERNTGVEDGGTHRKSRSWPESSDDRSHFLSSSLFTSLPLQRQRAANGEPFVSPVRPNSVGCPPSPFPAFLLFSCVSSAASLAALASTLIEEMMLLSAAAIMMEVHINADE